jgi:hypothetical protein
MKDFHHITCPSCSTILVVDRRTGEIVEERKPLVENPSGDRYEDALRKVKGRVGEAEEKFRRFQEQEAGKKERLDALFRDALERAKNDPDGNPPPSPFDRD